MRPRPSDPATYARSRRPHIIGMTVVWITGVLLVAFIATRWFVFDYFRVPSDSMYPTVPNGSFVIIDKRGYGNVGPFRELKSVPTATIDRGDLVVFYVGGGDTLHVKRVIGLPGDRVTLTGRRLSINDAMMPVELGERALVGRFQYQLATETIEGTEVDIVWLPDRPATDFDGVVPEGHYFMLGDNRDNARDSRFMDVGFVSKHDIIGKVVQVLRPE